MIPERALSIRQPWAMLILAGHKPVENRTWWTPYTGRIVVHAGKTVNSFGLKVARGLGYDLREPLPTGYLGTVDLLGVHKDTDDGCCRPWGEPGLYHWQLADPESFDEPVPGPGRLGLYRLPNDAVTGLWSVR